MTVPPPSDALDISEYYEAIPPSSDEVEEERGLGQGQAPPRPVDRDVNDEDEAEQAVAESSRHAPTSTSPPPVPFRPSLRPVKALELPLSAVAIVSPLISRADPDPAAAAAASTEGAADATTEMDGELRRLREWQLSHASDMKRAWDAMVAEEEASRSGPPEPEPALPPAKVLLSSGDDDLGDAGLLLGAYDIEGCGEEEEEFDEDSEESKEAQREIQQKLSLWNCELDSVMTKMENLQSGYQGLGGGLGGGKGAARP